MTKQEILREKILSNYREYKERWLEMTPAELIDNCTEVEAVTRMAGDIPNCASEAEADYLLRFKNPLKLVSDLWIEKYGQENCVFYEELSGILWRLTDTHDADEEYEQEQDLLSCTLDDMKI